MKPISNQLLAALASVSLLGATAFGQAVSGTGAPRKPSPPGSAGAESTTQGTGATGGVTDSGTRATSHGSELAPGSLHSVGGPSTAVDPARITGSGVATPGAASTSRFTPGAPGVPNGVGVGASGRGAVTSGTETRTTVPDRAVTERPVVTEPATTTTTTRSRRKGAAIRRTETVAPATNPKVVSGSTETVVPGTDARVVVPGTTTTAVVPGANKTRVVPGTTNPEVLPGRATVAPGTTVAEPAKTIVTGRGAGPATTGPGTSAPTIDTTGAGTGTGGTVTPPLPATLPGATTTASGSTR
jgi:hypothetical protein